MDMVSEKIFLHDRLVPQPLTPSGYACHPSPGGRGKFPIATRSGSPLPVGEGLGVRGRVSGIHQTMSCEHKTFVSLC
jgi:hypothetical protein